MTPEKLKALVSSGEADRIEMTRAAQDNEKFREAICSFSNDMAGRGLPGYLIIGMDEKDPAYRLPVTTEMLEKLVGLRSDGAIMPMPVMNVSRIPHPDGGGEVVVVEVHPHGLPPVRYGGRTHIRVGPRKGVASEAEERVLIERRTANFRTFDATPCPEGDLDRLDLQTFGQTYRPQAIAADVIAENHRDLPDQLAALRFYDPKRGCPTNAGMLVFAYDPLDLFPGGQGPVRPVRRARFGGHRASGEVLHRKSHHVARGIEQLSHGPVHPAARARVGIA